MSDDLVQFLRARLDEDERQARAAMIYQDANWRVEISGIITTSAETDVYTDDRELAQHIARHDPARVLDEVEAKRELIDEVLGYEARIDGEWGVGEGVSPNTIPALRLLARPFRSHPDFDQSWLNA